MDNLRNLLFLFPVMGYYLLESAIAALFVGFVWRFVLAVPTGIYINYLQWTAIIWIIKVVFFDVFKLISGLSTTNIYNEETTEDEIQ